MEAISILSFFHEHGRQDDDEKEDCKAELSGLWKMEKMWIRGKTELKGKRRRIMDKEKEIKRNYEQAWEMFGKK